MSTWVTHLYYPPEVSSMKYCYLGVFRKEYFRLVTKEHKTKKTAVKSRYSQVLKIRNTSEAVLRPQYTPDLNTDHSPMGLDQSNGLGEYCGPHTALSMFLMLLVPPLLTRGSRRGTQTQENGP